jgi:hypothetical protein
MKTGLNIFDLLALPPLNRQVVCLLLKKKTMSLNQMREEIPETPTSGITSVLDELVANRWLTRTHEGQDIVYSLQLQHTPPRAESELWGKLDLEVCPVPVQVPLKASATAAPPAPSQELRRGGKRLLPTQIWSKLDGESNDDDSLRRRPSRASSLLDSLSDEKAAKPEDSEPPRRSSKDMWASLDDR